MNRFILNLKKIVAELELIELDIYQEREANSIIWDKLYKEHWEKVNVEMKEKGTLFSHEDYEETDWGIVNYCNSQANSCKNMLLEDKKIQELNDLIAKHLCYIGEVIYQR